METRTFTTDHEAAEYCKAQDTKGWDVSAERHADGTWTVESWPLDTDDED